MNTCVIIAKEATTQPHSEDFLSGIFQPLTHQALVVWKLAQVQAAGPRYIRGWRTIYLYFTSNANR